MAEKTSPRRVALDMITKKAGGKIQSAVIEQIGAGATKSFSRTLGFATFFVEFVDHYSASVSAERLEEVKQRLEGCPHIGACEGANHAMQLVKRCGVTAWQTAHRFWYFHPQPNYYVKHFIKLFRYVPSSGGWTIEHPNRPRVDIVDCLGCAELHAAKAVAPPVRR